MPALRRLRQEGLEFKTSLRPVSIKKKKKEKEEEEKKRVIGPGPDLFLPVLITGVLAIY